MIGEDLFSSDYSLIYDAFYCDKDYAKEAQFLLNLYRKYEGGLPKTILDLAAGTGAHCAHFLAAGVGIYANDISPEMMEKCAQRLIPLNRGHVLKFACSPMEDLVLPEADAVDCATGFFTALGYLVDPQKFDGLFRNLRRNIRDGGYFFCDLWHARQAITQFSSQRVKYAELPELQVERLSTVCEQVEDNALRVTFNFKVIERRTGNQTASFNETHLVRYFSPREISNILLAHDFEILDIGPFMEEGSINSCWNFFVFARKRARLTH